jgi:hypothetical protein
MTLFALLNQSKNTVISDGYELRARSIIQPWQNTRAKAAWQRAEPTFSEKPYTGAKLIVRSVYPKAYSMPL